MCLKLIWINSTDPLKSLVKLEITVSWFIPKEEFLSSNISVHAIKSSLDIVFKMITSLCFEILRIAKHN